MRRDECTDQERWVLEQVKKGDIADLVLEYGPDIRPRRLRAIFLEALLTDEITGQGFQVHRKGIRVVHAVVAEPLDLEEAEIRHSVVLRACVFRGMVSFRDARFHRHLYLDFSHFKRALDSHRLRVGLNLFCQGSNFQGPVDFRWADIQGQFNADKAQFLSEKEVSFNALKVGQSAFFDNAVFKGTVRFVIADITGQFSAREAQFLNEKGKAYFNAMKVEQDAFFEGTEFSGPVHFTLTEVKGSFHIAPLIKQDRTILTIFHRAVHFGGAKIAIQLLANHVRFLSENEKTNFNSLKVGHSAFFHGAKFQGPVDFAFIKVEGSFYLAYKEKGDSLIHATFHSTTNFNGAKIGGQFMAQGAKFLALDQKVNFEGLQVGQSAVFEGAKFNGLVALNDAHLLDLIMRGNPMPELNLEGTCIDRTLKIEATEIGKVTARNLAVHGPATLEGATIKDEADLREARFQQLTLVDNDWPKNELLWIDGLTFKSLSTRSDPKQGEKWDKILKWLSASRLNTQSYSQVDEYFQRGGQRKLAYKVFLEGKRREVSLLPCWKKWPTRILWGVLAGYGRKPGRTFWVSLLLIFIGAFLFDPQSLKKGHWIAQFHLDHPWATRFMLSLDRFLPGVDLGLAKVWEPTSICFAQWLCWHVQKLFGWIIIPIALAAIYTRIK